MWYLYDVPFAWNDTRQKTSKLYLAFQRKMHEKKRKTHQENQQLTGIFVDRNADVLQDSFSFGPTKLFVSQVNKDQVVVRSSCDDGVTLDL